jgi:hypothetical protein
MRLRMLIEYQPKYSSINIKLYKASNFDSTLFENDSPSNFWSDYVDAINVISLNATHQNIMDVLLEADYFKNLLDK